MISSTHSPIHGQDNSDPALGFEIVLLLVILGNIDVHNSKIIHQIYYLLCLFHGRTACTNLLVVKWLMGSHLTFAVDTLCWAFIRLSVKFNVIYHHYIIYFLVSISCDNCLYALIFIIVIVLNYIFLVITSLANTVLFILQRYSID